MPTLEVFHSETDYRANYQISNRDIVSILDNDFDNVEEIVEKYVDLNAFEKEVKPSEAEPEKEVSHSEVEPEKE
mgnify:CR=1 FL=1